MRYPSLRTDGTQDSAPRACQCLQCADRQPLTRNRGGTLSGGLLTGTLAFATVTARAAEKGALTLSPHRFQPYYVEEEEGTVDARSCDQGTTGEAPPWLAEEADEDSTVDEPSEDIRGIFGGCNVR